MNEPKEDLKQVLKEKAMAAQVTNEIKVSNNIDSGNEGNGSYEIENIPFSEEESFTMVPNMAVDIEGAKTRVLELQNFIKFMMVPNIDYGFIPGCAKPMLFKPGAEKLCDIYGLTKQVEVSRRVEDWEKGIFHYEVKVILINKKTGHIEAEGVGCCNNKEKKFATQDPFSVVNSILKMAKKRAVVDATLSVTRTSGIFSQDLETM